MYLTLHFVLFEFAQKGVRNNPVSYTHLLFYNRKHHIAKQQHAVERTRELFAKSLGYLLFHGGTRYLRIYSIAVHPDYRGRGLGQILMDQTILTAGECKATKITLEVKVTNTSAIGLYMKNGFIPAGIKPCYYHDGLDAIYMQRLDVYKRQP